MRRIKSILALLAVLVMMTASATPAMADGWWENCQWNWSWWWGWFLTCDWNPGSGWNNGWGDSGWGGSNSSGDNGWGSSNSSGDNGWGDHGSWGDNR